jgi:hypothetical protein
MLDKCNGLRTRSFNDARQCSLPTATVTTLEPLRDTCIRCKPHGLTSMYYGLFNNTEFYQSLKSTEQARGLITFLFVLSTSGVILLIAIAIFWMDEGDNLTRIPMMARSDRSIPEAE